MFDVSEAKATIRKLLRLDEKTISEEPFIGHVPLTRVEMAAKFTKLAQIYAEDLIDRFNREVLLREKVLEIEKAACVTVVAEYQKRIAELESKLESELGHKQYHIDSLMFEYCPDEMTQEQKNNWATHQQVAKEK